MAIEKTFNAAEAETRIYQAWERAGCFEAGVMADPGADSFCIMIPPPNVTGSLHMGHAFNNTLQDILIRWNRMKGRDTLWQPGTDHAGIATQMVVERQLALDGEPPRRDLGREKFLEKVWEWKEKSGDHISSQLRRLGASADWSRERFTMDEGLSRAVTRTFVDLYNQDLIYKGKRLVNWDPRFETAISDLEVEQKEVQGHMWHFKYPLAGGESYQYIERDEDGNITLREERNYISIATTRPETMLGDGAVAVHPEDERYAPIVGQLCEIPVGPKAYRRLIPIITDDYPDPGFGSGAVKITGAHDFNDYGVAMRNSIPLYVLMDGKARMRTDGLSYEESAIRAGQIACGEAEAGDVSEINLVPEELRGLDRYEARKAVIESINAEGLAVTEEAAIEGEEIQVRPYVEHKPIMQPHGDRSGVVIEPMLTDQWFVDAEKLVIGAKQAVRDGRTKIIPEQHEKVYFHWLENIEPWCISRQLWWGHQVPVWYGPDGGAFCAHTEEEAQQVAEGHYGEAAPLVRDPDVLDTWFSSALWPFSTLGWPEETAELRRYYKTDVLVTGFDILFFWVARMMMMGLHLMDEVPFHTVYIHALVLDEHGKKMSKSVGNVIDPIDLIDGIDVDGLVKKRTTGLNRPQDALGIEKRTRAEFPNGFEHYGADAVRFTLTSMAAMGRNLRLSVKQVEGNRNFGTKLWNAARFCEINGCRRDPAFNPLKAEQTVNKWIIGETARALEAVDTALEAFRFNDYASALYTHIWNVFCDWYVEFAKPLLSGQDEAAKAETRASAAWALDQILHMLHPVMPFITEELWAVTEGEGPLMLQHWPKFDPGVYVDARAAEEMRWVISMIEGIRSVRSEMNVPAGAQIDMVMTDFTMEAAQRLLRNGPLITKLARLSEAAVANEAPEGSVTIALEDTAVNLPLAGVIDVAAETARLGKSRDKLVKEVGGLEGKLSNAAFIAKAPEDIVNEQRERLVAARAELTKLEGALGRLSEMG